MADVVEYDMMESPIGALLLASTDRGLCLVEFGTAETSRIAFARWARKWQKEPRRAGFSEWITRAKGQLEEYFAGQRRSFDVPLDLYGTPFQLAVWSALTRIPYGETRSYKEIALSVGAPKAVRAIGNANHCNPIPIIVPCHRVIGSNGALVGYGGGLSIKEHLLRLEGALSRGQTIGSGVESIGQ